MSKNYYRIWLKSWPKLLVTGIGVALYVASFWAPEHHRDLVQNISANIISIPIIFLIYEIWNEKAHQKLHEAVYQYASNEMSLAMADAKEAMSSLAFGVCAYLDNRPFLLDDRNINHMRIMMRDGYRVERDEDDEDSLLIAQNLDFDWKSEWDSAEDIFSLDKNSIVPVIADSFYLGFQIRALGLGSIIDRLGKLISNPFVMEKMDDKEATIIVEFDYALKMLQSFMATHENLFCEADIKIEGFDVEAEDALIPGIFSATLSIVVDMNDEPYIQPIGECKVSVNEDVELLTKVHIVNRDCLIIFGDLVDEVIHCIERWRSDPEHQSYLDFARAKVGII